MTLLARPELASLRRAVGRRSRGQVRIPAGDLGRELAIALWRDVATAFSPGKGRVLTDQECAHLRQRAWRFSHGYVALSDSPLTLDQGLALWALACQLGELATGEPRSRFLRAAGVAAFGLAATQLAACTTFLGSNVKGSFSCSAPGGTCAPSTVIDDQALSLIQNARPMVPETRFPAGPTFEGQPRRSSTRTSASGQEGRGGLAAVRPDLVHRERRVLKVVFPSYVDGAGNFHEPRVVHTVADEGGWMQLSAVAPTPVLATSGTGPSIPEASAAMPAGSVEPTLAASGLAPAGPPDPRVVAAARARGTAARTANPIDAIKAEVDARLGQSAKAPGGLMASPGLAASPADVQPAEGTAEQAASRPKGASQPPATGEATSINPPASFPAVEED